MNLYQQIQIEHLKAKQEYLALKIESETCLFKREILLAKSNLAFLQIKQIEDRHCSLPLSASEREKLLAGECQAQFDDWQETLENLEGLRAPAIGSLERKSFYPLSYAHNRCVSQGCWMVQPLKEKVLSLFRYARSVLYGRGGRA